MVELLKEGETYLFRFRTSDTEEPTNWSLRLRCYVVVRLTGNSVKVAEAENKDDWDFSWYTNSDFEKLFTLVEQL